MRQVLGEHLLSEWTPGARAIWCERYCPARVPTAPPQASPHSPEPISSLPRYELLLLTLVYDRTESRLLLHSLQRERPAELPPALNPLPGVQKTPSPRGIPARGRDTGLARVLVQASTEMHKERTVTFLHYSPHLCTWYHHSSIPYSVSPLSSVLTLGHHHVQCVLHMNVTTVQCPQGFQSTSLLCGATLPHTPAYTTLGLKGTRNHNPEILP
jgi:hypothetical protein